MNGFKATSVVYLLLSLTIVSEGEVFVVVAVCDWIHELLVGLSL